MLKYENIAVVGDRIRAYDFPGRTDCYVEGIVERIDTQGKEKGFACFIITVDKDGWKVQGRVGCTTYVPIEVAFMEYDGRIVNLSK